MKTTPLSSRDIATLMLVQLRRKPGFHRLYGVIVEPHTDPEIGWVAYAVDRGGEVLDRRECEGFARQLRERFSLAG